MGRTDRASLLAHVDRDTAFAALTDPDALAAWLPPAGMRGRFARRRSRTSPHFSSRNDPPIPLGGIRSS